MPVNAADIKYIEIFPPIGIARFGNSDKPDGYYLAPQVPTRADVPKNGDKEGIKDDEGKVLRQAVEYRAYAFDENYAVLGELKESEGYKLKWTADIANAKCAYWRFRGKYRTKTKLRNLGTQADLDPDQRNHLIMRDQQSVEGKEQTSNPITGKIKNSKGEDREVYLGELRTDAEGRLIFLGGKGNSHSILDENDPHPIIVSEFDATDWVDDSSDGSITVEVTDANGTELPKPRYPAWAITAPPKYVISSRAPTSLYELLEEVYEQPKRAAKGEKYDCGEVNFYRDIWPIFHTTYLLAWTNPHALHGHGPNATFNFLKREENVNDPKGPIGIRQHIFSKIRAPVVDKYYQIRRSQASHSYMPILSGDNGDLPETGDPPNDDPNVYASMTELQYDRFKKWSDGNFVTGEKLPTPECVDELPLPSHPWALTYSSLEWTIGAPLFPGIETWWASDTPEWYNLEATFGDNHDIPRFRIKNDLTPGHLTRGLSLPWQCDFYLCNTHWWPSVRPDDIIPQSIYEAKKKVTEPNVLSYAFLEKDFRQWARGLRDDPASRDDGVPYLGSTDLARDWARLGFIYPANYGTGDLPPILIEHERDPTLPSKPQPSPRPPVQELPPDAL